MLTVIPIAGAHREGERIRVAKCRPTGHIQQQQQQRQVMSIDRFSIV